MRKPRGECEFSFIGASGGIRLKLYKMFQSLFHFVKFSKIDS